MADTRKIVNGFLSTIDKEKISSLSEMINRLGERIGLEDENQCFLEFSLSPSNIGTKAYTLSYIIPGEGVPLEVRINQDLGYSRIVIRHKEMIQGYNPFMIDGRGITQEKMLWSTDMERIIKELKDIELPYVN